MIKSRRMRWAGYAVRMGEARIRRGYWLESQKERDPLGRPRRRWVNNIKMDLRDIGCDSMDWIDVAHNRDHWRALVNRVMNLRVP
jgi:hypothetical protein